MRLHFWTLFQQFSFDNLTDMVAAVPIVDFAAIILFWWCNNILAFYGDWLNFNQ